MAVRESRADDIHAVVSMHFSGFLSGRAINRTDKDKMLKIREINDNGRNTRGRMPMGARIWYGIACESQLHRIGI